MPMPVNDLIIKQTIEQGIQDLISQPWLVKDLMSGVTQFPSLAQGYAKEIQNCLDWIQNNKINIYLKYVKDDVVLPAITIALGSSNEDLNMRTSSDVSTMTVMYAPSEIGKPIPYLIKPFTPISYDSVTGIFGIPSDIDLSIVNPGQILLNPITGEGYIILDVSENKIEIEANQTINWSQVAVFPQFPFFKCKIDQTWYRQTFSIGVHIASDPAPLLWLEAIVSFILLRYKITQLEARNFCESSFSISDFAPNINFSGPESAYSRYFTLTGVTPYTWPTVPSRLVEAITFKDPATTYTTIKILSNLNSPQYLQTPEEPWTTVEDDINF